MRIRDLLRIWADESAEPVSSHEYRLHLSVYDAAKVAALCEMFPGRTQEQILAELIGAALNELQGAMPYQAGSRVQMVDEEGDPVYEDVGLTRRLHELADKHLRSMRGVDDQ